MIRWQMRELGRDTARHSEWEAPNRPKEKAH